MKKVTYGRNNEAWVLEPGDRVYIGDPNTEVEALEVLYGRPGNSLVPVPRPQAVVRGLNNMLKVQPHVSNVVTVCSDADEYPRQGRD